MAEEPSRPASARRWWIIGGSALVVVALVVTAVSLLGGGRPAAGPEPSPSPSVTAAPTTPVPSPSIPSPTATGSPTVVPTGEPSTVETGIDDDVQTQPGVTASVERIEAVDGEARGPGEIAGPALRVTIRIQNTSDRAVRSELGLINLYYGKDRTPAGTLSGPGAVAFPNEIPAGGTGTGTSVFNVPAGQRDRIRIEFSYSTDVPVVIFSGAA